MFKKLILALFVAAASAAPAVDLGEWLGRRAILDREAERLQVVYSNCVAALQQPAEDITVPIENHPDGAVKASVTAKKAQFFIDAGYVWGEGVSVYEYEPDGKTVRAEVHAEHCVVDRKAKSGWAEGHASARYGATTVEGDGIYFSFAEEFVKILSNVVIRSDDLKLEGVKL